MAENFRLPAASMEELLKVIQAYVQITVLHKQFRVKEWR